jgi:hypothetical protein
MGYERPKYDIKRMEATPFKPPRPIQKTTSPPRPRSLIQKSIIISKNARNSTSPKLEKPSNVRVKYKSQGKRTVKELSPDSDDEPMQDSGQTSLPSTESVPAFILPPEFDFSAIRVDRKSLISAVFQSPDDLQSTPRTSPSSVKEFEEPPQFDLSKITPKSSSGRKCPFCRKGLPNAFVEEPPTAPRARYGYCKRHEDATTLEEGKRRGYPELFDFNIIQSRVLSVLKNIQIQQIIKGEQKSEILQKLRTSTSNRNAATPMAMFQVFDLTQPGYYGPRGVELITRLVMERFADEIRHSTKLPEALRFCGGVMGYVSSVIVPEVGIRLIMEDKDIDWAKARQIMKESVAYGSVINPALADKNEDDDESVDGDSEEDA